MKPVTHNNYIWHIDGYDWGRINHILYINTARKIFVIEKTIIDSWIEKQMDDLRY